MIRAIETTYKGIKFRSRLEAKWAVFFDLIGLEYEYESAGYKTPYGAYLPDFLIHNAHKNADMWYEIKGIYPSDIEISKLRYVCENTGIWGVIAHGSFIMPEDPSWPNGICREAIGIWPDGVGFDVGMQWCKCQYCGAIGNAFDGRAARICSCNTTAAYMADNHHDDKNYQADHPDIIHAARTALNYRFGAIA